MAFKLNGYVSELLPVRAKTTGSLPSNQYIHSVDSMLASSLSLLNKPLAQSVARHMSNSPLQYSRN